MGLSDKEMAPQVLAHPGTRPTEAGRSTVDIKSLAYQGPTRPYHFAGLRTEYLRAIREEEACLGRQLTPSQAERINHRVFTLVNRAAWAGCEREAPYPSR